MFNIINEELNLAKFNQKLFIAIVSDIHLKTEESKKVLKSAVKKINKRNVDVIFLLGDFISYKKHNKNGFSIFRHLKQKRIFAVIGNHDYGMTFPFTKPDFDLAKRVIETLEENKIKVLRNDSSLVNIKGNNYNILGVDDCYTKNYDFNKTYLKVKKQHPIILLSHNPDIVLSLKKNQPTDLIISGHTHGGTVRLPVVGAFHPLVNTRLGREYDKGFKYYQNRLIYITSGLGKMKIIPRIFNPPEIVFLNVNF